MLYPRYNQRGKVRDEGKVSFRNEIQCGKLVL